MPFAQLMAVLPLRDVACSLRVPSNSNGLKCNKDENETVIAHRSDCGLFLFRQKKGVRQWMSNSKLIELSYYDPSAQVRLSAYADTLVLDHDQNGSIISAIRFGGYPEMVRAMADAIYGGATIEAAQNDTTRMLQSSLKSYQRQITHDGIYAVATLMAADTVQEDDRSGKHEKDEDTNLVDTEQMELQPRRCYIFCPARDQKRLFEELDHKTAAPLIPEFQDYVLSSLRQRGDLRQLEVISLRERIDAWVLDLKPQDQNVVEVLEQGLQSGAIQIPGTLPGIPDGFENVENVTGYLNTFGVTVADRIRNQFMPLFDPAKEPLSDEVLAINDCIMSRVGYSLYDAQLAVAEAVKRQLARKRVALIIAECGSGKTKIGSTALGALHGLWADQKRKDGRKSFGIVMCPSHVTQKWVREIGETLPDTYGMVVRTIQDLNRLYAMYEKGDKSVFAVFSKEQARDGYMRYPAVRWNRRRRAFLCPDCDGVIEMEISEGGSRYTVPADQFFFQKEHKKNHTCPHCGTPLWSAVNPDKRIDWVKIGEYGWVYRYGAQAHLHRTKNERVLDQLTEIAKNPDAFYPIRGAHRRFPLSTYIKKKLHGRIDGFLCDELHEYNNNSGQGDAMAELYGASRCFVGMTATLINGYSSGIFHLLYRIVPGLMLKDGKRYKSPDDFDAEYGVVENTYEIQDAEYNSNRRTSKRRTKSKQLPGVSPLVFSRFLLEYTAFLSLSDMGKDLPDYEEIPVPLEMPEDVRTAYKEAEHELQKVLRTDRKAAQKILSTYLNLLTVYPDQPYDQAEVVHPINGMPIVTPKNCGDFSRLLPKEERVLELVRQKAANGERVLIYTSWTRTDSQKKLQKLLCSEGYRTEILTPQIATDKREDWVNKRVKNGLQVLITNPRCVETGLDLNAFTTIIFYSMGYNLFTLRQASRRSWRINQTAPRVEVYMLYYADTMQAKAMKLMASKLAVAGIIEGTFSEEGLAAMSDVKDLTSQMAKELALGIRDNVEDIAAAFRKMAVMNPERKKNIAAAQLKETAAEEQKAPAAKDSFGVRTAQAQVRQALYEGLLARTAEEQKKRKSKKAEVDENQLSIFGFAA